MSEYKAAIASVAAQAGGCARAPISSTTQMHVHFMRSIARVLFSLIILIYGYIRFHFFPSQF